MGYRISNLYRIKLVLYLSILLSSLSIYSQGISINTTDDITSKNENMSRNVLQSKIEELNDQIDEKKESKKELKKLQDEFAIFYSVFENSLKISIDASQLSKELEDFIKTKNEQSFYRLADICFKDINALRMGINTLTRESKSVELQNLQFELKGNLGIADSFFVNYDDNGEIKSISDVSKLKETFSVENITKRKNEIQQSVSVFKAQMKTKIDKIDEDLKKLNSEKYSLLDKLENKIDTTETIFKWGFPVFIVFILILYLIPLLLFKNRSPVEKEKDGELVIYSSIYGTGLIVEIITIFLLTSTILLLGLTDKISSEILGTLIGGISGYVLGKSFKGRAKENE